MWITRKAILQEISKNHDSLADRLKQHINVQENESASIRDQLNSLEQRLESLEATYQKELDTYRQNHRELKDSLGDVAETIQNLREILLAKIDTSVRELEENTKTISQQETETVAENLRIAADKISECIVRIGEDKEKVLTAHILQTGETTAKRLEAIAVSLRGGIAENLANLEALVRASGEEIAQNEKASQAAIFTEVKSAKKEIVEIAKAVDIRDGAVSASFKTMEATLQQILKSLSSLDEGNRLLIAKTLLKDLGD